MEDMSILALQEAYERGETTPAGIVSDIIEAAEKFSDYNVWIEPPQRERLQPYVERLESMGAEERAKAPLWGIPFAVKDNIDVAGYPTTAGCPAYAYEPAESATVVARLVDAGAIPVGKTNLDQFATGLVGTRSPYGECHNALDPALISGGSSSGSAVAVALGLASFALGTDTAGSGRVPAALHGIYGFKPACGAWSTRGVVPACASLDCPTVFARTLDDVCAVDAVVAGYDPACDWSRELPRTGEGALPATIYLPQDEPRFYGDFADEYRENWQAAIAQVERAASAGGLSVEPLDARPFSNIASILYDGAWVAERWSDLGSFVREHAGDVFPVTRTILESGDRPDLTAADAFEAMHTIQHARHECAALFDDAVMVMPTCGGTFTRDEVRADPVQTNSLMGLYTNHCNLCDLSALAVPAQAKRGSLPFGITVFSSAAKQRLNVGFARAFSAGA